MKKLFFISSILFLSLTTFAFAYSRSPSGTSITSPVSFNVLKSEVCSAEHWNYWTISVENMSGLIRIKGDTLASTTSSYNFSIPLEIGSIWGYVEGNCKDEIGDQWDLGSELEAPPEENVPIFTIISGGGGFSIIPSLIMASSSDMVASVGTLFTDLWIYISLMAGIPLAFYIIQRTTKLVPASENRTFTGKKEKEIKEKKIIFEYETDIHGHKQIKGGQREK